MHPDKIHPAYADVRRSTVNLARVANARIVPLDSEGPYRRLYHPSRLLWPDRPGRMVKKAAERIPTPGRALDIGCGDGKDVVYLEGRGWEVTGFDINNVALGGVEQRAKQVFGPTYNLRSKLSRADAAKYAYPTAEFDLVIAYGLYPCLDDEGVAIVQKGVVDSLRPGGLFAFAAFNDTLPVPDGHGTDDLFLRGVEHIFAISANDFVELDREVGEIREVHRPLLEEHGHALTWALLKKKEK